MNETIKTLIDRRSIRRFKPDVQVEEEKLQQILEAGKYAASGAGSMPVKMIVIQDKETRDQLMKMNAQIMGKDIDPFYGAPTIIAVVADVNGATPFEDGCLTLGNLMNAAHALDVDSIWIHRAKQEFDSAEGKALLKKWGLEGDYMGIGHCALGYRDCDYPDPIPRKDGMVVRV